MSDIEEYVYVVNGVSWEERPSYVLVNVINNMNWNDQPGHYTRVTVINDMDRRPSNYTNVWIVTGPLSSDDPFPRNVYVENFEVISWIFKPSPFLCPYCGYRYKEIEIPAAYKLGGYIHCPQCGRSFNKYSTGLYKPTIGP